MSLIEKANEAYYNKDEDMLTDKEFDLLQDNGLEIKNFRNKVDHFQPMGSLKKVKTEDAFYKFVPKGSTYRITPKLDGNSVEIVIANGKFIQGITRGDGFVGNDISKKIQHCNIIHNLLDGQAHYSIKCEAIMKKEYQKNYSKNIRNVVAGILNRKSIQISELNKIDIIPFMDLDFIESSTLTYQELKDGYKEKKEVYPYDIDGLVVELKDHIHPEKDDLLPENIMALKFNKKGVLAEIGSIEWGLGKHAKLTPVIVLKEGVEIDGTTVRRVSASNWSLLVEAGLGVGAIIRVIKSGDIIPFVSEVIEKREENFIPRCPACGSTGKLDTNKIQMRCGNPNCKGLNLIKLQHIFKTFDLEYISDRTVEKLYENGVKNLEQFFSLTVGHICGLPGFGLSKGRNIVHKLKNIKLSEAKVLKCAMVKGISESNGQRLIDHYGNILNFFGSAEEDHSVIEGFAEVTSNIINSNMVEFIEMYMDLKNKVEIISIQKTGNKEGPMGVNIIFTGKCETHGRKELTKVLQENGYNVQKSMNKETEILLCADVTGNSSKLKKAKKLGIKIQSYVEFFKEN